MSIQKLYKRHTVPVTLLLAIMGALLLSTILVSQRTQAYQQLVEEQLNEQYQVVQDFATAAAQNQAGSAFGVLITDCPQSQRLAFDRLLGRLDAGPSRTELLELDQLFSACAHIRAERKAVIVAQLKREVQVLHSYAVQLGTLTGADATETYGVDSWEKLVEYEATQSEDLAELVVAQKNIIEALLDGKSADSEEMLLILDAVKESQESLLFAGTQATTIRTELLTR